MFKQWGLPQDKLKYTKPDLTQAKQLLTAAGVDPASLHFKILTGDFSTDFSGWAVQFQADLKKLGKAVKPAEMTDILNRLKALDANRSNIPLPKGPVPTSMKGMRGNLRGR